MRRLTMGCLTSVLLFSCMAQGEGKVPRPNDPSAKEHAGPALPRAKVILHDAWGGAHQVQVEVAATESARTRGLMWRTELPGGKGMLFIFSESSVHAFWMRNTLIPLDMAFITANGILAGIVANAVPQTLTSRSVGLPSKYVLEVPGGWFEKKGISPGSKVEFQGLQGMIPVE